MILNGNNYNNISVIIEFSDIAFMILIRQWALWSTQGAAPNHLAIQYHISCNVKNYCQK
jgi:hypothetical protein